MTVIAGYIDDHRHLIQARGAEAVAKWMKETAPPGRMRELLESGVTTVQSGGDDSSRHVLELKRED